MPTGFQRAPFFDVQTDEFALIAVDTGIVRSVDPVQWQWLEGALGERGALYQSFVEMRVEPSTRRVRILPFGVTGRLRWRDLQGSADLAPAGAGGGDFAEWSVAMREDTGPVQGCHACSRRLKDVA